MMHQNNDYLMRTYSKCLVFRSACHLLDKGQYIQFYGVEYVVWGRKPLKPPDHISISSAECIYEMFDGSQEQNLASERLLQESLGPDEDIKINLTGLKLYTIQVNEADELDDALNATKLHDDCIKVRIHVAHPTSLVEPGSMTDKEVLQRGTFVSLPTTIYLMFPEKLATEGISLKQVTNCKADKVSVVLHSAGSIEEHAETNSTISPTRMLLYKRASELLHLYLEEEFEFGTGPLEPGIKVENPEVIRLFYFRSRII